jgi:hypothetical protein
MHKPVLDHRRLVEVSRTRTIKNAHNQQDSSQRMGKPSQQTQEINSHAVNGIRKSMIPAINQT